MVLIVLLVRVVAEMRLMCNQHVDVKGKSIAWSKEVDLCEK